MGAGDQVEGRDEPGWHHFSSSHGEWGNDSVESFEYHDACSWACYLTIVRRLLDDWPNGPPDSLDVDDKDPAFLRDMLNAAAP